MRFDPARRNVNAASKKASGCSNHGSCPAPGMISLCARGRMRARGALPSRFVRLSPPTRKRTGWRICDRLARLGIERYACLVMVTPLQAVKNLPDLGRGTRIDGRVSVGKRRDGPKPAESESAAIVSDFPTPGHGTTPESTSASTLSGYPRVHPLLLRGESNVGATNTIVVRISLS